MLSVQTLVLEPSSTEVPAPLSTPRAYGSAAGHPGHSPDAPPSCRTMAPPVGSTSCAGAGAPPEPDGGTYAYRRQKKRPSFLCCSDDRALVVPSTQSEGAASNDCGKLLVSLDDSGDGDKRSDGTASASEVCCLGFVTRLVLDFFAYTTVGRAVSKLVYWVFGAHFMRQDDAYDVILRKAIISAIPAMLFLVAPVPYYGHEIFIALQQPAGRLVLTESDACPGASFLRKARPTAGELATLLVFAAVVVVWTVLCSIISIRCRYTGRFSVTSMDLCLCMTTVATNVGLHTHAEATTFYAVAVSIMALVVRSRFAYAIVATHVISFDIQVVNILTGWKATFTHYRGNPQNAMVNTKYETAFYYLMGMAAFLMTCVAVGVAVSVVARETAKLRGALKLSKQLANLTRSYDVDSMREALEVYGADPDCDREILMMQRAVLANLEAYRPHIPAFLLEPSRSSGSDAENDDVHHHHVDGPSPRGAQAAVNSPRLSSSGRATVTTTAVPHGSEKAQSASASSGDSNSATSPIHAAVADATAWMPHGVGRFVSSGGGGGVRRIHTAVRRRAAAASPRGCQNLNFSPLGGRVLELTGAHPVYYGLTSYFRLLLDADALLPSEVPLAGRRPHTDGGLFMGLGAVWGGGLVQSPADAATAAARRVDVLLVDCFRAAEATHGSVLGALGDEITVAWNAARRVSRPNVKACEFALLLRGAIARGASNFSNAFSGGSTNGSSAAAGALLPRHDSCAPFASYVATARAACLMAGDAKQRMVTTVALNDWHQRVAGLGRVARVVAASTAAAAAAAAAASAAPSPRPMALTSPVADGPSSVWLITVVDDGTHQDAKFTYDLRAVGSWDPLPPADPSIAASPLTADANGALGSGRAERAAATTSNASPSSGCHQPQQQHPGLSTSSATCEDASCAPLLGASEFNVRSSFVSSSFISGGGGGGVLDAVRDAIVAAAVVAPTTCGKRRNSAPPQPLRQKLHGLTDQPHGTKVDVAAASESTQATVCGVGFPVQPQQCTVVYELLTERCEAKDEWMYQLAKM